MSLGHLVTWDGTALGPFLLWALNYQLPHYVTALPEASLNSKGIILACNGSLRWERETKTTAAFYCSFLSHVSINLTVCGSCGSLRLDVLAIPCRENMAFFSTFNQKGWTSGPEEVRVESRLPQEASWFKSLPSL